MRGELSTFVPDTEETMILSDQPFRVYGVRLGMGGPELTVKVLVYSLSDSMLSAIVLPESITMRIVWLPALRGSSGISE